MIITVHHYCYCISHFNLDCSGLNGVSHKIMYFIKVAICLITADMKSYSGITKSQFVILFSKYSLLLMNYTVSKLLLLYYFDTAALLPIPNFMLQYSLKKLLSFTSICSLYWAVEKQFRWRFYLTKQEILYTCFFLIMFLDYSRTAEPVSRIFFKGHDLVIIL